MDTNEKVRKELDRKDRVDYIREKDQVDFEKSIIKVKTSQSPKKSPLKSPARSPGKTLY